MLYIPFPFKHCSKCGEYRKATTGEFRFRTATKDHLTSSCRQCGREAANQYRATHHAQVKQACRVWYKNNRPYALEYAKEHRLKDPQAARESHRRHYWSNPERARKTRRKSYLRNIQSEREYGKLYRHQHADKVRASQKRWSQSNPDKLRQRDHRKYSRRKGLPATFTEADWARCVDYWRGVCAYCGKPPRLWDNPPVLHQEHHVPQAPDYVLEGHNPGYSAENIVPACMSCNSSKKNHSPHEWIRSHFGPHKAEVILKRIQDYFEWICNLEQTRE